MLKKKNSVRSLMTRVKKWAYKKDGQIVKILYGRLWQF